MMEAARRGGTSSGKKIVCTAQSGLVVVVVSASFWMEIDVLVVDCGCTGGGDDEGADEV